MDTDRWMNFTVYIKTDDIYERHWRICWNSTYELDRHCLKEKNKKMIGLMKDELVETIMTKSDRLRAKIYSYLIDNGSEDEKAIGTKMCVIKRKLKFESYNNCWKATGKFNKFSLSLNDDKRIQ